MLHRHAVHEPRQPQREMREVERCVIDALRLLQQRHLVMAQDMAHHVDGELVVPRRHRRVRREHYSATYGVDVGFVELEVRATVELPLEETQGEERRVT